MDACVIKPAADSLQLGSPAAICRWIVYAFVFTLAAIAARLAPAADSRPPNIVLLLADDVGYDDIGCCGSQLINTPNIDNLAREGRRFTSYYAPSSVCTPSRAALMTGCYAQRVGLPSVLYPQANIGLNPSEIALPELLKSRGYATACIGKWHLGHHPQFMPFNHGFDVFFGLPYPNDHGPERPNRNNPPIPLYRGAQIIEQPVTLPTLNDRFIDEAKAFLNANREKPFFLYLPFVDAHTPWYVAERFRKKSKLGPYGDAVQEMDWGVGQVLQELKELGLEENTLVIFASDNGPLWVPHPGLEQIYGDAGRLLPQKHLLREGKYSSTEGGVRVPMIARWPGKIPAATECAELVAGFDFYPTLAELAGADLPRDRIIDGKNIMPLLRGEPGAQTPHDRFFYFSDYKLEAVRSDNWKLRLVAHDSIFSGGQKRSGISLYDLERDLGESKNLAAEHPEVVNQLQKLLDQCRHDLGDGAKHPGPNRRAPGKIGDEPPRSG
jgi:arylsulfatase A-like enzyme